MLNINKRGREKAGIFLIYPALAKHDGEAAFGEPKESVKLSNR